MPPLLQGQRLLKESCPMVKQLTKSYEKISEQYRKHQSAQMQSRTDCLAYVAARFPATFAVIKRVLQEVSVPIESFLDVGAGPGTGAKAVQEMFGPLKTVTLLERNKHFIAYGKEQQNHWKWIECDLEAKIEVEAHDLVLVSYAFGELSPKIWKEFITFLWTKTNKNIIFIEPGTPKGFSNISFVREHLLNLGAHLIAPCPHPGKCPIQGSDWCHFSVRLPRTSEHRQVKQSILNYEDEKFSYLIASKEPGTQAPNRILRHPIKRPGHIQFTLCTEDGIKNLTVTKKQKDVYKRARKAEWHDSL